MSVRLRGGRHRREERRLGAVEQQPLSSEAESRMTPMVGPMLLMLVRDFT